MIHPRVLFVVILVALVYWAPQWMPSSAEKMPEPKARVTEQDIDAAAERILREGRRNRAALPPDQRELYDELDSARAEVIKQQGQRAQIMKQQVRDKLMKSIDEDTKRKTLTFYEWAAQMWQSAEEAYDHLRPRAESWVWSVAFMFIAVCVAAALAAQTRIARATAQMGLSVARVWLVVVSLLSIALTMATRVNPWAFVPHEFIFAPLAALLGCGIALRLVDFNYPVWNPIVRGCGAPVISIGFVAAYLKLV